MQTKSHISAAALAAALFAVPQLASGQILGVDLDLDVLGVEADADVDVGGDKLLDVDAGVDLGGDTGLDASVDVGGTDADDSLVDIDLNASGAAATGATGPNGGRLIDLNISDDDAALDADIDLLPRDDGTSLVDGTVRIGALDDDRRGQALLDLIDSPNLAEIDLDTTIDDRRVSILAAADLLAADELARIDAAITAGGEGRDELLAALDASVELGGILGTEGIDPEDVLAVQVADNGAAEIIVLDRVQLALLGDDAEDDGQVDLADLTVAELGAVDVDLLTGADSTDDDNGNGGGSGGNGDTGGSGDDGSGSGSGPGDDGGAGTDGDTSASDDADTAASGQLPSPVGARFGIALLDCNIGVLALANGVDATPRAIAGAESLELVRIDGCERSLVDAEIGTIRTAIAVNPAITDALDDASIPLDHVIGATIQGGTLTLFVEPALS